MGLNHPKPVLHGRDHLPGGSDPIPATGGGDGQDWCLIGTGTSANLAAGAYTASIQKINTNAPSIFEAVLPSLVTQFHDVADDPFHQARWALDAFQIRAAKFDAIHVSPWSIPTANPVTHSLTVSQANELVYVFALKDYIRGLTSSAPFTLLYSQQVPNLVSGGEIFACRAGGQGSGGVTWTGNVHANDLIDTKRFESIMVGLQPFGGTPTQIALQTTYVDSSEFATAILPPNVQANDLVLLQVTLRNGNAPPNVQTPAGWTLLGRSPNRTVDVNCGVLDQYIYVHSGVVNQFVLQIDQAGVYELHSSVRANHASATGAVETTLAASGGGTLATWDGGNYLTANVGDGTLNYWRANQTKILAVDTAPVQVSLHINNRTGTVLTSWEAGIFARRLGDPLPSVIVDWDI